MEPYIENQFQHHHNNQSQPSNSGLLRFRSAPSSLLSSFKGYDFNQSPTPDSDQPVPRFGGGGDDSSSPSFEGGGEGKLVRVSLNGYSGFGQNQLPPQYPKQGLVSEGPFRVEVSNAMSMDQSTQGKVVGVGSNLTRQSSSPAGFFSHLNAHNGYGMMRGIGQFKVGSGANGGEESNSSPRSSRLKGQIDFTPGLSTSLGRLPRIPEISAETAKESSPDEGGHSHRYKNGEDDVRFYNPGASFASWNDPSSLSEGTSGLRRHQHGDKMLYSGLDASVSQNGGLPQRTHMLSHHLSLPKTSSEMAAMEKLLTFQDTVPCKIRAKRGCATHPRSIAERVRRTRISERMKKLQDLVPNMDKQVNTADMLDLAVDYIKDLQKQYKTLSDVRARCKCLHLHKAAAHQAS